MATTKTFPSFNTNTTPASGDYLVGYYADGSQEFKTTYSDLVRTLNHDTALAYTHDYLTHAIKPVDGNNTASGNYSVVTGGINNVAATQYSAVVGGNNNLACSTAAGPNAAAFVGGGHDNCACGPWNPVVVGGAYNRATGSNSFVGGGCGNHAYGYHSTIVGGTNNRICNGIAESVIVGGRNNCMETDGGYGSDNTITGGQSNSAYSWNNLCANTISGGYNNCIDAGPIAAGNTISGGYNNTVSNYVTFSNTVGGGSHNSASGYACTTVAGGGYNCAYGECSTIGGGNRNEIDYGATAGTIAGGRYNCICEGWAPVIAGGQNNYVHGGSSTIGGGKYNCVGGYQDGQDTCVHAGTIAGGDNNCLTGNADASTIGGGCGNSNSGYASTVSGGYCNHSRHSDYTVIGGGCSNTIHINNHCSSILGGANNDIRHDNSHIIGSNITSCQADTTFVNNLVSCGQILAKSGFPAGGSGNVGFGFSDGDGDTGLFSFNTTGGEGLSNDGWVSLYSNDQEVLQAANGGVNYIRLKSPNGTAYNITVTNSGSLSAVAV